MTILAHLTANNYLNILSLDYKDLLKKHVEPQYQTFTISNYTDLVETTARITHEIGRSLIVKSLEDIDLTFRNSDLRKRDYVIKVKRSRTIVTVFGTLTFIRTIYQNKSTGKCFTYVDRKMGLPKYDKFDPTVKALIVEQFCSQNSMIKIGQIVGKHISEAFSQSDTRHENLISRQTVFNIISKSSRFQEEVVQTNRTPEILYIMADEKYVPIRTGQPGRHSQMVKHCVLFEGVDTTGKRNKLINKRNVASTGGSLWSNVYDIVSNLYDIEKIKQICIMGDGASWIKAGVREFDSNQAIFVLDKFHYKQAIEHISKDPLHQQLLISYSLHGTKKDFKLLIQSILETPENRLREKVITDKQNYILNQWKAIRDAYNVIKIGCSMEAAISHNLAAIFTNRPKAYKSKNLEHYVTLRMMALNGVDIQKSYLSTFHLDSTNEKILLKENTYDLSILDLTPPSEHSASRWINRTN